MFGAYRLALALAVSVQHLLVIPVIGDHALHGFFVLSGFLMTRVMNQTYGYSLPGIRAFLANRALRLYPVYWATLAISALIIWQLGESNSREYRHFLYLPNDAGSLLQNLTLIFPSFFPGSVEPRLSPPSWSLTVEIFYYFIISIGVSRTPRHALFWFSSSAIALAFLSYTNDSYRVNYAHLIAQSLPFSLGAVLYHYKTRISDFMKKQIPVLTQPHLLAAATAGNTLAASGLVVLGAPNIENYATYTNLLLQTALIAQLDKKPFKLPTRPIDQFLGDLTYPIFLLHWQIGFMTAMLAIGRPTRGLSVDGVIVYTISIIACFFVAIFLSAAIDRPVQSWRAQLRPRQPEKANVP